MERVSIFWDFENCRGFSGTAGQDVVKNIRHVAHSYGQITLFKAYADAPSTKQSVRSDLQVAGVSLVDCPHNGKKEVADKMMIVDMMAHAMDNPAPGTVVLITGDRDFAYVVSVLRMRQYRVVVIVPPNHHGTIRNHASVVLNWDSDILSRTDVDVDRPPTKSTVTFSHPTLISVGNRSPVTPVSSGAIVRFQERSRQAFYHLLAASQFETNVESNEEYSTSLANVPFPSSSVTASYHAPNSSLVAAMKRNLWTTGVSADLAETFGSPPKPLSQTTLQPLFDEVPSLLTNTLSEFHPKVTSMEHPFGDVVPDLPSSSPEDGSKPVKLSTLSEPSQAKGAEEVDIRLSSINPSIFFVLVRVIREHGGDTTQVLWSKIRSVLVDRDPSVYEKAGVTKFKQYVKLAVAAGVVLKGGKGTKRWVSLPPIQHADFPLSSPVTPEPIISSSTISNRPSSAHISLLQQICTTVNCPSELSISSFAESSRAWGPEPSPKQLRSCSTPSCPEEMPSKIISPSLFAPSEFATLVEMIKEHHGDEVLVPYKTIRRTFLRRDGSAYKRVGVKTFGQYVGLAVQAGVVLAGGVGAGRWMYLHPNKRTTNATCLRPEQPAATSIKPFSDSHLAGRVPDQFALLVEVLRALPGPATQFLRETVRVALVERDPQVFQRAGVPKFRAYLRLAVAAKVVILQGQGTKMWISLHPRTSPAMGDEILQQLPHSPTFGVQAT